MGFTLTGGEVLKIAEEGTNEAVINPESSAEMSFMFPHSPEMRL